MAGEEASRIIASEGVIVFPTETVYGVGGLAESYRAVVRVFQLKGRPPETPLTIHVSGLEQALRYVEPRSPGFWKLADLWPGPLSIVEPASHRAPAVVRAWGATVGVRVPDHPATLKAIEAGGPIVGPSANPSGRPSPVTVWQAVAYFGDAIDLYIDGGEARYGIESTVVEDVGDNSFRLLRAGATPVEALEELGVRVMVTDEARGLRPHRGGYYRYSPGTPMAVVDPGPQYSEEAVVGCLARLASSEASRGRRVLVLTVEEHRRELETAGVDVYVLGSLRDPVTVGKRLSMLLPQLPDMGYQMVLAEAFGEKGYWLAITAKLRQASQGRLIDPLSCRLEGV